MTPSSAKAAIPSGERNLSWCCLLLTLLACSTPRPTPVQTQSPTDTARLVSGYCLLAIRGSSLGAEIARTAEQRAFGLMYRTSLAPDSGMLFVFESTAVHAFWMKNTLIPLSIAFVDSQHAITDILEMAPLDTTTRYFSSVPVRYALEMNSGWFQAKGIKPGDTVLGIPR